MEADRGTLFLDEVDSLAPASQVKLLRLIQEKEYRRLGESRTRQADIRIIAATNADLLTAVREKRFREDLFFRLRVIRKLKESPTARDIPIVVMTAFPEWFEKNKTLAAGCDAYFVKPLNTRTLSQQVGEVVARKAQGE